MLHATAGGDYRDADDESGEQDVVMSRSWTASLIPPSRPLSTNGVSRYDGELDRMQTGCSATSISAHVDSLATHPSCEHAHLAGESDGSRHTVAIYGTGWDHSWVWAGNFSSCRWKTVVPRSDISFCFGIIRSSRIQRVELNHCPCRCSETGRVQRKACG